MNMEHHQVMKSPKQEHQKPKYRSPKILGNFLRSVRWFKSLKRSLLLYIHVS